MGKSGSKLRMNFMTVIAQEFYRFPIQKNQTIFKRESPYTKTFNKVIIVKTDIEGVEDWVIRETRKLIPLQRAPHVPLHPYPRGKRWPGVENLLHRH
jgi:hypothetical protein